MSHPFRIRVALAGAVLPSLVLAVVACGSSIATPRPATAKPATATTTPSAAASLGLTVGSSTGPTGSAEPSPAAGIAVEVRLASGAFGSYLVGRDGRTLYTFLHDSPGGSTCNFDCAVTWPPFVLSPGERLVAGDGVTGPLDLVTRVDGATQVEYRGHPLYTYSGDAGAGQTTGQSNGSVWSVARP